MADAEVPTPEQVRALLARGSGSNFAATAFGVDDSRLRPRTLPLDTVAAGKRVVAAVNGLRGWRVVGQRNGVIHATRTTRLFRFTDDVLVLLEPRGRETVVWARSASRVGRGDFGQNRRNLAELWGALGLGP